MKIYNCAFVFILCFAISGCSDCTDGRESSTDKHEWSILQVAESQSRDKTFTGPQFQIIDHYELMVIPSLKKGEHVWIMLKPTAPPFYKQLPDLNYEISNDLVDKLVKENRLSSTVEEVLRSRVQSK